MFRSIRMLPIAGLVVGLSLLAGACESPNRDKGPTDNVFVYQVVYDGNGHEEGAPPVDNTLYHLNDHAVVLGNTGGMTVSGSQFAGWNTAVDGSGLLYGPGQTLLIPDSNVILHAVWTTDPTYTVTYDGNGNTGGAVPVDTTHYLTEQTVTASNSGTLAKTGYAFSGWNTQADGNGASYAAGSTFSMGSADVTLYAKWSAVYTVTYNANGNTGGSTPTDSGSYLTGATVTVKTSGSMVKAGYSFSGWNTAANGSGTTYAASSTFTMGSADVTLYAKWTPVYTVTYSGNGNTGGSVPTDSATYLNGTTVTTKPNSGSLTKTGYSFSGWNTAANGSGTTYAVSSTFTMGSGNVTLYAKWTLLTYTVTYNGNGSTGGTVPVDGNTYSVLSPTVTVLGNTGSLVKSTSLTGFTGWNTASDHSGSGYTGGQSFSAGGSVTLYAQWGNWGSYLPGGIEYTINSVYAAGSDIVVGTESGVWKSTSTGSTFASHWTTANGLGSNSVKFVTVGPSSIYAATTAGLSITTNSGGTWTNYTTSAGLASNYVKTVLVSGSSVYAGTTSGLSVSTNGTTWTTNTALGNQNVNSICISGANWYVATDNGLFISTNSGTSWGSAIKPVSGATAYATCVYATGGKIYLSQGSGSIGGLSISSNGGTTWTTYNSASGMGSNLITSLAVNGSIIVASTGNGFAYSLNGGSTWQNNIKDVSYQVFIDGSVYYLATGGDALNVLK